MDRKRYTYEEISALVIRYKNGDREAAGELFTAFSGFIAKYANFLKFGAVGRTDKDLHSLMGMLCPKGDDKRARMSVIRKALESYDYEDIQGELNILFLEATVDFKARVSKIGGDVPFAGYLYAYFKYKVKRWLDKRLTDVMNTLKVVELKEEEIEMQMLEDTQEFEIQFSSARPILDSVTRWILHLYYTKGLQDREIGNLVRVSGNWICGQRRSAIAKLRAMGMDRVEDLIRGNHL